MEPKKSRTGLSTRKSSLPNIDGTVFKVGDGVHWGFNGDCYPGTIVKISKSGRKIWVSEDGIRAINRSPVSGHYESNRNIVFVIKNEVSESELKCFTLRKHGHFTELPGKSTAWALLPERKYTQNPSF